ncbi:TIGR03667 family PPOX class F420-dependent oxidoreductase [Nocardiopsis coralliicola]
MTSTLSEAILRRAHEDSVIWLGTVTPSGRPTTRPVWFYWDGSAFVLYSEPGAAKVRHIEANPNAVLNFNTAPDGEDVAVVFGTAVAERGAPPPSGLTGYMHRYRAALPGIGYSEESFDAAFSVRITVAPVRSWGF